MSTTIVEKRVYYRVFAILLLLLMITVAAVEIEHRTLGVITALTVAVTKAVLILLYFMHLRYTTSIARVFAVAAFVWLAVLLMLTASDYLTRNQLLF